MRRGSVVGLSAALLLSSVPPAARAAVIYGLDPSRSSITFTIGLFGIAHRCGRFSDVSGTLTRSPGQPQEDAVAIDVRTASVDCGSPGSDRLVAGPRFFDSARFPVVRFQSRRIAARGELLEISGDLTLHGVTRAITLTAEAPTVEAAPGEAPLAFTAKARLKRSDFSMTNYRLAVGDDVLLSIRAAFTPRLQ